MLSLVTLEDLFSVTSSPESAYGASPCDKPDGLTTGRSGQAVAHANLSARQAKAAGLMTSGTYGPRSIGLLDNALLNSSLASRLHRKTALLGSTLYRLTWKRRATPSGRQIPALRASALRTSGSGSTGWPTPHENATTGAGSQGRDGGLNIQTAVHLAAWPTPMAGTPAQKGYNEAGNNDSSRKTVALAGWASPTVGNADGSQAAKEASLTGKRPDGSKATVSLNMQAQAVGPARLTASGKMLTGSAARMESGGQLHPEHSLWLQLGPFATAWARCAERVTRSTSRKRKASSKP